MRGNMTHGESGWWEPVWSSGGATAPTRAGLRTSFHPGEGVRGVRGGYRCLNIIWTSSVTRLSGCLPGVAHRDFSSSWSQVANLSEIMRASLGPELDFL